MIRHISPALVPLEQLAAVAHCVAGLLLGWQSQDSQLCSFWRLESQANRLVQVFYALLLLACLYSPAGVITVWSDCSAEVCHSAVSIFLFCIHA